MITANVDLGERNKEIARDHLELVWNRGRLDLLEAFIASDFINFGMPCGVGGLRQIVERWRTAFSDLHFTMDNLVAEGDQVFAHCTVSGTQQGPLPLRAWSMLPPAGKRFTVRQMHCFRLQDGKIAEHWAVREDLAMLIQLGHIQVPGA